jgi:hypothetical protein
MWAPFVLFGCALVSLVFGVLMMLQVKSVLDEQRAAAEAAQAAAQPPQT